MEISYRKQTTIDVFMKIGDYEVGHANVLLEEKKLVNFGIYPEYRDKGYGQKFLQFLIDEYDIQELDVKTDNEIAKHIYEKIGFKYVDRGFLTMRR